MSAESSNAGRRRAVRLSRLVMVVAALVPMLLSAPGQVSADSRQYLYLDPGAFLARATSLWDPSVAAGTVPHQHLGFLWPMGSWFWLVDLVGAPTWIGQRIWLAAVVAVAGLGAHRLARALGCGPAAALVAALAYQLTPYQLAFTARFSVLLLPWAALPWLVHLTRRSVAERTWHAPLAFGLVATTAGSVNASSLLLVMLGPAVVLVASAAAARPAAHAISAGARIAICTTVACAWWLAGVFVQGRYGLPVLQLTENVDTVAAASTPDDVIRGLGNWIFVSTDGATTAIDQAAAYTESTPVRLASAALPAIALAVLAGVRIRGRGAIAAALALATVVAVGPAPLGDPSAYGRLWRTISDSSSVGLALRNTPRIVPVLVLAVALALALAVDRLGGRVRFVGAAAVIVVIVIAIAPVARHGFLDSDFTRPERLPERWTAVAADLDTIEGTGDDPGSRVLELPGANFAAYSWGNTVEPVLAGLVSRPTIAREVLPAGGFGTVNLLGALDRSILNGTFEPRSLAPVARLLGVGDIVIRGDLDTSRFGLPSAAALVARLDQDPPPGFRVSGRYGTDATGRPLLLRLTLDAPTTLLRADAVAPVLLAGDGAGIVDAAATGLIDGNRTILPAVTVDDVALDDALGRGAEVIVTDTNRKAATTFFYTIADDVGATETADATEPDPTGYDVRLGPYAADADVRSKTVAVHLGGSVSASAGGGPERPEHRPVHAFDGDPSTAWRPRAAPVGQAVSARFDEPVSTGHITIRSTPDPASVHAIRMTVDGGLPFDVELTADARGEAGQRIELAATTSVRDVRIELLDVGGGPGSAPGLVDVKVGDAVIDETLRLPTGLIASVGDRTAGRRVTYVLSRMLGDAAESDRQAVERDIDRLLTVATPDVYSVSGSAVGPATGCRDDLLTIDGASVSVEITASGDLRGCETPALAAGEHRVRAPNDAGEINRLVLTAGPPAAPGPTITPRDTELGLRSARATIDAVGPFWFTLAQSRNDGWSISVDGGTVVSTAMTDGYANGWLIEPSGEGPVFVRLTWTPQRFVWAGFAITGLLVPAAIVVFGRRPRGRDAGETADDWQASSLRPDDDLRRRLAVAGLGVAWAASWWFVGGVLVSALAVAALVVRLVSPHARLPLAAGAAAAVVAAEFTDRPSLVFVGLSFALAEIVAARASGDQEPMLAWNE